MVVVVVVVAAVRGVAVLVGVAGVGVAVGVGVGVGVVVATPAAGTRRRKSRLALIPVLLKMRRGGVACWLEREEEEDVLRVKAALGVVEGLMREMTLKETWPMGDSSVVEDVRGGGRDAASVAG